MSLVTTSSAPPKQPIAILTNDPTKPVLLTFSPEDKSNSKIWSMKFNYREVTWHTLKPAPAREFTQADINKLLDSCPQSPSPSSSDPKIFVLGRSLAERWQRIASILPKADQLSIIDIRSRLGQGFMQTNVDQTKLSYFIKYSPHGKGDGLSDEIVFEFTQNILQSIELKRGLWVTDQAAH